MEFKGNSRSPAKLNCVIRATSDLVRLANLSLHDFKRLNRELRQMVELYQLGQSTPSLNQLVSCN